MLVVRQSDGLPGQGWWVGGAKKHGYTGQWEGPKAAKLIRKLQRQAFEYWAGRGGVAFANRATMADARTFTVERRRRRHPARPLVQAAPARGQLQPRLALGADRPAPARRQARDPRRPDRGRAGHPRAAARSRAGALRAAATASANSLTEDEEQFVREMVIYRGSATPSCSTSRRASRRRAAPRPPSISTACSTASPTTADGPSSSTGSTRTRRARCWSRGRRASAGHFAKAFSGRTARKVYWALVVGVPPVEEGLIDAPLAKQPGTGGEKMHVDRGGRPAGQDPLARDRPRRQPRRLGRAAAADRPHAPAARAHGGDRPSRSSATPNMAGPKRS